MTGAIAGTASLNIASPQTRLHTVGFTVNNYCNLDCGYCYLRDDSNSGFATSETLGLLSNSEFEHLAIVGKEPLASRGDAERVKDIVRMVGDRGKTASLITNGAGLKYLGSVPRNLSYVDISFDGGLETFKAGDLVGLDELSLEIERLRSKGVRVNALQTIYGGNLGEVDKMMRVREIIGDGKILFSPYLDTRNYGRDTVSGNSLIEFVNGLSKSKRFVEDARALSAIDSFHLKADGMDVGDLRGEIEDSGLEGKVDVVERDPLEFGIIRLTYDGKILTPEESLHVRDYTEASENWADVRDLNEAYGMMVA